MNKYCQDCGSHISNGFCENCHEAIFIREQYIELDMEIPDLIEEECTNIRNKSEK